MKRIFLCIAAGVFFVSAVRADEFHLKDGTTVVGTLVAYEKNVYRVKTAYGYAEIERSAVVSITVSNPKPEEKPAEKPAKAKSAEPAKPSDDVNTAASKDATPEKNPEAGKKPEPEKKSEVAGAKPTSQAVTPVNSPSPIATAANSAPTAIAPATQPATAPEAAPVKEEVRGNQYINDTYGFQMYKPPDWDVIEGARAALPGSIVAMGTSDQTTYLIIGLVPASGTLQEQVAATNDRLAGSFEGYQPEQIHQTTIAGLLAHEYQFHGAANDKEWTGTVALIQRGGNFFTILGVTSTNTDLVQMEQNVITRTIASLQFTAP